MTFLILSACRTAPATTPAPEPQPATCALPPKYDPRTHACNDGRTVEYRLGLLNGAIDGDPLVLREQALLTGVRSEGVLTAYDHGVVLGGVGDAVTVTQEGAWSRVALGPRDLLVGAQAADFDNDADDDLLLIVERSVVDEASNTATALPFAHVLSQEPDHHFALRATLDLQLDSTSYKPLRIAELTGDGKLDFAVIHASQPVVYRGDGALRFERRSAGPQFPNQFLNAVCTGLFAYDRDGDADTDLLAICEENSSAKPFMFAFDNAGGGRFVHGPSAPLDVASGARTISELQDLTGDGRADALFTFLGGDAEPRLALLRGDSSPLKLGAAEVLPIPSAKLAGTGSVPRLFTTRAHGPGGVTEAVLWTSTSSKLMTLLLGKNRGDAWLEAEHRIDADHLAAIVVRDSASVDQAPTVQVLLDVDCGPPCTPQCKRCSFDRCVLGPDNMD